MYEGYLFIKHRNNADRKGLFFLCVSSHVSKKANEKRRSPLVVLFQVRSVRPGRTYIIAASRRREASETCDITLSPLQPCTSIDQITAVSRSDVHSPKLHDPFFSFLFFSSPIL